MIDVANVNISTSKYVVSSCCGNNNESHVDLASSGKLEWLQQWLWCNGTSNGDIVWSY